MPKANLNPADAYRKAQRKKELRKNKTERAKARDFALVKKDTTDLEEEIEQLESGDGEKTKLAQLKAELENIKKKKEEYLKEHPEQRGLVYRRRRKQAEGDSSTPAELKPEPKKRNLFNKKGLPRHPERSVYYDPVLNPYGVPPPGMPYLERPLRPDEVDSEAEGSDEDATAPNEPPPGYELVESDDEIFLPEGPPPIKNDGLQPPALTQPSPNPVYPPPLPLGPFGNAPPPPPPLPSMVPGAMPPPSAYGALGMAMYPPPGVPPHYLPPPPTGYFVPPLPPPGFFPRNQPMYSIQDPLSTIPHTTYQAHRANRNIGRSTLPHNPSLPPKPIATTEANATVVAAPQLRDFKKEATEFVPTSLKRKKPTQTPGPSSKVNAAPSLGPSLPGDERDAEDLELEPRPDLVGMLKTQFGATSLDQPPDAKKADVKKNDDYAKFMEEMGDIL